MEPALSPPVWPLVLYSALVIALMAGLLAVSRIAGERTTARAASEVYESGMLPVGDARVPVPAKFFLVAMFFVIFDLEAVYLFAWAVALERAGWTGFIEMAIFIGVLLAALVYLWKRGALDAAPRARPPRAVPPMQEARTDALVAQRH